MTNYAPILLFVYNRPEHTQRVIASLRNNEEANQSHLFVYSDSWKDNNDETAVRKVRQLIHSISGFKEITIIERNKNWGLAHNIIDGVTTQVNRFGRVIVIEDDLLISPYFLRFMNEALECYKNEQQIGHIQAYDFTQNTSLPDTFLIKWTGSWGWATWDRAWKFFNPDGKELLEQLKRQKLTRTFDFNDNYPFTRMLRRQIAGKNNSWAIRWNASLFLNNILSLNVGKSLVQNTGFDGSGTNCGGGGLYSANMWMQPLPVVPITPIEENKQARKIFEKYYHRTNNLRAKVIRRIKRILKGDFKA